MSDGQTLLLLLAFLYLSDCFIWIRKESVAFVSYWRPHWRIATLRSWFGNSRGGLLFLNPLPGGRLLRSHLSPISISPEGICTLNVQTMPSTERPPAESIRFLTFSQISDSSTDGSYLLVNNEKFAKCATPKQAKPISELIKSTARASHSKRAQLIRSHIGKQFALDDAGRLLQEAESLIEPIRWVCLILFLFLFVIAPLLVTIFGLYLLIPVAAVMILLAVQISIMFYRAHKKLYPGETQERIENLVKMILCPPVSIRATDILSRDLLSGYSPVAVATLLRAAAAERFVSAFILDLKYPLKHEASDATAAEIMSWAAAEQLKSCLQHIEWSGYSTVEELFAPPSQETDTISYCPRCGCQYVVSESACPDCPGVGLAPFPREREPEIVAGGAA